MLFKTKPPVTFETSASPEAKALRAKLYKLAACASERIAEAIETNNPTKAMEWAMAAKDIGQLGFSLPLDLDRHDRA